MNEIIDSLETIANFLNQLSKVESAVNTTISAFMAILALAVCFFGYRLIKVWVSIIGFIVGWILSFPLCSLIIAQVHNGNMLFVSVFRPLIVFVMIGLGMLGGFLAFKIYKVGVFILSGFIPALLVMLFVGGDNGGILLSFIVFIVLGIIGVLLTRPYLIGMTSIGYGLIAGQAVLATFRVDNVGASILVGAVIATLGFIYQWKTTKPQGAVREG